MAHGALLLGVRADHKAGGVAQRNHGQTVGLTQLHKARGLVTGDSINGTAQMHRVVGDQAEGAALDTNQRGDQPRRKLAAQLQHRIAVGQCLDHFADVIHAQAVFRDQVAQLALVRRFPVRQIALEVGQVLLGHRGGLGFVLHPHVDHPVRAVHAGRANLLRGKAAEAAAFDHRRPGHADGGVLGGDDHVAAAEQRGVTGEAAPGDDTDGGHHAG